MISELTERNRLCKGLGGSMHLIDIDAGVAAAVPIVGSTIPIGTGLLGDKLNNKKNYSYFFW